MFKVRKIKLFYFIKDYNFGDILNVWLLKELFDVDVEHTEIEDCRYLCIGSLLHNLPKKKLTFRQKLRKLLKPAIKVWGTGFIIEAPKGHKALSRRLKIYAVRGKVTQARLKKYKGVRFKSKVLGDPGLLVNKLLDQSKIKKKYKLGIIPHYVDKGDPLLDTIRVENSVIIDIQQDPKIVLRQIAECENILSSAMHGLIVSDALGIPNARLVISGKLFGGDYKFHDYYSAFGLETPPAVILQPDNQISDISFIKQNYKIDQQQVEEIRKKLIKVFPAKRGLL